VGAGAPKRQARGEEQSQKNVCEFASVWVCAWH
jgi:hypothetical protein